MISTIKLTIRKNFTDESMDILFPINTTVEKVKEEVSKKFNLERGTFDLCAYLSFFRDLRFEESRPNFTNFNSIVPDKETFKNIMEKHPKKFHLITSNYNTEISTIELPKITLALKTSVKINEIFQKFSMKLKVSQNQTISKIKKTVCEKFNEKYKTNHSEKEIKFYYLGRNITEILKGDDTKTLIDFNKLFENRIYNEEKFNEGKLNEPITFKFSKKLYKF